MSLEVPYMLSYYYPEYVKHTSPDRFGLFGFIIHYRKSNLTNIMLHTVSESGFNFRYEGFSKSLIDVPHPKPKANNLAFAKFNNSSHTTDIDIFNPLRLLNTLSKIFQDAENYKTCDMHVFDINDFERRDFYNPNENFVLYAKILNKRFHPVKVFSNKLIMGNHIYTLMEEDKP